MPFRRSYREPNPMRPKKVVKRRVRGPKPVSKPCVIQGIDGSVTSFSSVKAAKRALAAIIATLPPRKSKDEPKRFFIVK